MKKKRKKLKVSFPGEKIGKRQKASCGQLVCVGGVQVVSRGCGGSGGLGRIGGAEEGWVRRQGGSRIVTGEVW